LLAEDKSAIVSIESTPFEHWLATTDPKDFALMQAERAQSGLSGSDLIARLASRFPHGASAALGKGKPS
jgi:hypothetical protein